MRTSEQPSSPVDPDKLTITRLPKPSRESLPPTEYGTPPNGPLITREPGAPNDVPSFGSPEARSDKSIAARIVDRLNL